jgi:hypothetical protein
MLNDMKKCLLLILNDMQMVNISMIKKLINNIGNLQLRFFNLP